MSNWLPPFASMDSVTVGASTIGDVLDLGVAEDGYALLTWVVVHSGDGPWSIEMQGSLDDSNW